MRHERAFTLLEVALAVLIAMLIILAAVPSVDAIITEREFKRTYDAIEALVAEAQTRALTERRPFTLVWEEEKIVVRPAQVGGDDAEAVESSIANPEDEGYTLELPAALGEEPAAVWTFWPTGACEPAIVRYHDGANGWTATYNPLSARAVISGNDAS